jgi:hypothetical protein
MLFSVGSHLFSLILSARDALRSTLFNQSKPLKTHQLESFSYLTLPGFPFQVIHAWWPLLGVVGILTPEALEKLLVSSLARQSGSRPAPRSSLTKGLTTWVTLRSSTPRASLPLWQLMWVSQTRLCVEK